MRQANLMTPGRVLREARLGEPLASLSRSLSVLSLPPANMELELGARNLRAQSSELGINTADDPKMFP